VPILGRVNGQPPPWAKAYLKISLLRQPIGSKACFSKVDQLRGNPEIGRIVPEINERQFRELIYGDYRIIYHIGSKQFF
jgi:hypothetical protein